jgi:hypothetical protein
MTREDYLKKGNVDDEKDGDGYEVKIKGYDVLSYLKHKDQITSNDIENLIINGIDLYTDF